jgi:hypothetical protein
VATDNPVRCADHRLRIRLLQDNALDREPLSVKDLTCVSVS